MHVCLYIFNLNGKGQNLPKSVLVFQWPLEWQAQRCTTSPRSWEVSHFVYVVEISWISNNFVVGWLKSVKNLMCFIYNLLHRFVCWDHNVKQKYIQGHYNHEGVLDGKYFQFFFLPFPILLHAVNSDLSSLWCVILLLHMFFWLLSPYQFVYFPHGLCYLLWNLWTQERNVLLSSVVEGAQFKIPNTR